MQKQKLTPKYKRKPYWLLLPLTFLIGMCMLFGLVIIGVSNNEDKPSEQELQRAAFLTEIGPAAKRIQAAYDIPASIIMAQAALESNFGQAELAAKYHNLFGVKASAGMDQVTLATQEFVDDEWHTVNAAFRNYPDWTASMIDHAQLIRKGTLDNPNRYQNVTATGGYEAAAHGLVSGGYATDPKYADKLISMIETYDLDTYDK